MTEGRLCFVVGARPNFPKVAPILAALAGLGAPRPLLVHTGQHYDAPLSGDLLRDLGMPAPDVHLGVGRLSRAERLEAIASSFESVCRTRRPTAVVVVGDVDSTLACALAAVRTSVPVAHVEAGLRSFDRSMPEEVNRIVVDSLASRLYTHSREADDNLRRESVPAERVAFVGNVMIDTLLRLRPAAVRPTEVPRGEFGLVTLHRPSLVDSPKRLAATMDALEQVSRRLPLLFPMHPRTAAALSPACPPGPDSPAAAQLPGRSPADSGLTLCGPLGYLEFLWCMDHARVVITDSGGVQEETTGLGVPCLTLRTTTERPVTIRRGTNRLLGADPAALSAAVDETLAQQSPSRRLPELWDGRAAVRVAEDLLSRFC